MNSAKDEDEEEEVDEGIFNQPSQIFQPPSESVSNEWPVVCRTRTESTANWKSHSNYCRSYLGESAGSKDRQVQQIQ